MDLIQLSKALKKAAADAAVDVTHYKLGSSDYKGGQMVITFDHDKKTFHVNSVS